MQPLNPFLSAFSKSHFFHQCQPVRNHILLVPLTSVLLSLRDVESGAPLVDAVASDEFIASHVLRVADNKVPATEGKDAVHNLREMRGKAKVYSTINGRNIVIKDNMIYTNKGFKGLAQAQLLHDTIWYTDTSEPAPFLIYYISRPLVGSWEETKLALSTRPNSIPGARREQQQQHPQRQLQQQQQQPNGSSSQSVVIPRKKDIKSFHDLLCNFPAIARQMQPGLEKMFRDFHGVFERQLPPPPSASHIPDPEPEGPIAAALKRARSNSASLSRTNGSAANVSNRTVVDDFDAEDDEEAMRVSLETAITTAIDLFQAVDKQQLSLLGATTELTGPLVERLIERYVTENVHHLLFPRLAALKRRADLELESKIRQMDFIDISQLGIVIDGGWSGKQKLIASLSRAVEEFRKLSTAMSPQEMMEVLLRTTKAVTQLSDSPPQAGEQSSAASEKQPLTVNADTLVSLLLYVVIKAQVKNLQARFTYIRHFIFIDDVDTGEIGYALSTFEAVLSYLDHESGGLRRASRRNKALWDAAAKGDVAELARVMEPVEDQPTENGENVPLAESPMNSTEPSVSGRTFTDDSRSRRSSSSFTVSERFSLGSGLAHVFPFQAQPEDTKEEQPSLPAKRIKRVAMDTRSMSSSSEISFRSRATSIGTIGSGIEGDTSTERLALTQDSFGESVPMMAVQNDRPEALRYLLSLKQYYSPDMIIQDRNNQGTTLFSAAVQHGHTEVINILLDYIVESLSYEDICRYLAIQDAWGRSAAHYLFHAPFLIQQIGRMLPWRQKDKNGQTPLFALCRSYDHASYHSMVEQALHMATLAQGDGQPLHLDDHVDAKGNTLLHVVNDAQLTLWILQRCDADVNATNDKRFTALMVASKYGRLDMVRALFSDPRVDVAAKELRGLTAVELAKDDDVRNKIDDLSLFSLPAGRESRTTRVVRSYFVEDGSVRFVVKSGAPVDQHSYAVTTCRRSLADFERLERLLSLELPASWIPSLANLRSPTQIPSKPSRAVLKDLQVRVDWFLRILLAHPTFATHEMLWEFFLVPDLQPDMMEQRSKLKAETRAEKVRDELEPLDDVREVEQFVEYAKDMVSSLHYSTRDVAGRAAAVRNVTCDLHEASQLLAQTTATLTFLPASHKLGMEAYVRALNPSQSSPVVTFHGTVLALHTIVDSVLKALARPQYLISQITSARRDAERNHNSLTRSNRWPLGLLDDARQRLNDEREERARKRELEAEALSRELRYTQQTVAQELAGWREMHESFGRRAIRQLARNMVTAEKTRLEGLVRALRRVRDVEPSPIGDRGDASAS
ncbi:hypothetical protein VTK73DRAFT_9299 [Phialemonium thermophilum]|uniref:VPS9 domain-containing protein n=1 Tax=Phialemonium thermophilum TaxID=223376 RepID=A0ABR3XL97_9PEZI